MADVIHDEHGPAIPAQDAVKAPQPSGADVASALGVLASWTWNGLATIFHRRENAR